MVKIDLITGFLGAGKTTFLRRYASWLLQQGQRIGILENDFGAVNVDMMLLGDLEGDNCELEMLSGGCDAATHRRRFRTKLIAMGMSGLDRVVVEPSGIYDMDEFFDVLHEEPLDQWYEIGNIIAVVDARLESGLSREADILLASETACAGCVVLSRTSEASREQLEETLKHLNQALEHAQCGRTFAFGRELLDKDWALLTDTDFQMLSACGYRTESYAKSAPLEQKDFEALFFMNIQTSPDSLERAVKAIFEDGSCGSVFRVKGFFKTKESGWLELNATRREITIKPIDRGQEILIAVGEGLVKEKIESHLLLS